MPTRFTTLVIASALFCLSANAQDGNYQPVKFDAQLLTIDSNEGIDIADVNGDGKPDVVAGRNWFAAPDFRPRPLRSIDDWNGYVESNGDFIHDVNGDGQPDVVAGSFKPTEVYWYENPGPEGLKLGHLWPRHLLVDTQLSQNEGSFLHDLDGDKVPEWISNSWNANNPVVAWKFSTTEAVIAKKKVQQPTLTRHLIGESGHGHGMGFGDINNDGREDILVSLGWYERPEGDVWKGKWKFHADWKLPHASVPMLVRDLNRDGKQDLIWGKGHDYGLLWWEGKGVGDDGKLQFTEHVIDDRYSQTHSLLLVDLDGDGAEELVTGKRVRGHNGRDPGGTEMPCMYYYRWNAKDYSFDRYVIEEGHVGIGLQIRSADLNGDNRPDLAVAGKDGTWILFSTE